MEGSSEANPLGLPRNEQGGVHQLELKQHEGTGAEARGPTCIDVVRFLPTILNGVVTFNSLLLTQQIAAILIMETDQQSHQRLEGFLRAPVAFRELALVNPAHYAENSLILFNEMDLGHIVRFLQIQEAMGHQERVGALPEIRQAGRLTAGARVGATRHPAEEYWLMENGFIPCLGPP